MLGSSSGPKLWIELHNEQEFYTNGDHIFGTLFIESSKPFSVQQILISMRCEEQASVWVTTPQGGYYDTEVMRYLLVKTQVFPDRSVRSQQVDKSIYTLQSGSHKFDFEFQVPLTSKYPQSLTMKGTDSGIRWFIKGVIHRGQVFAPAKRTVKDFQMIPAQPHQYDSLRMITETESVNTFAYLPGYGDTLKTASGKIRGLFSQSEFRKRITLNIALSIPESGLLQQPNPLNIDCDLSSEDASLLLIKSATLLLKRKIVVTVHDGWHTATWRTTFPLVKLTVNETYKAGLALIQEKFANAVIDTKLPQSATTVHIRVSYKLVAEIVVAPIEKPSSAVKVRVSVPVIVNSVVALGVSGQRTEPHGVDEALPIYAVNPQAGEATISSV